MSTFGRIASRSIVRVSILAAVLLAALGSGASPAADDANGKLTFRRWTPGTPVSQSEIWMMNADGTAARQVSCNSRDDLGPEWSPDGQTIVFFSNERTPDPDSRPIQYLYLVDVGEGCRPETRLTEGRFPSWSPVGRKLVFEVGSAGLRDIVVREQDGTETNLTNNPAARNIRPDWSPDGRKIVFARGGENEEDIYVMNAADGSELTRLTFHPAGDNAPQWSPDGRRIVFQSDRDGNDEIYVMNADGTGETRLTEHPGADATPKWSPSGRQIVFHRASPPVLQLFVMNADGTGATRVTDPPTSNTFPAWGHGRIVPLHESGAGSGT